MSVQLAVLSSSPSSCFRFNPFSDVVPHINARFIIIIVIIIIIIIVFIFFYIGLQVVRRGKRMHLYQWIENRCMYTVSGKKWTQHNVPQK